MWNVPCRSVLCLLTVSSEYIIVFLDLFIWSVTVDYLCLSFVGSIQRQSVCCVCALCRVNGVHGLVMSRSERGCLWEVFRVSAALHCPSTSTSKAVITLPLSIVL